MKRDKNELKVRVSRPVFWTVTIGLLLLPLSTKYRLLIFGHRAHGVVMPMHELTNKPPETRWAYQCNVIRFYADGKIVQFSGPENANYQYGQVVPVLYLPHDPTNCMVLSFSGLFLDITSVIPLILFVLWLAFYFAFAKNDNKSKKTIN